MIWLRQISINPRLALIIANSKARNMIAIENTILLKE